MSALTTVKVKPIKIILYIQLILLSLIIFNCSFINNKNPQKLVDEIAPINSTLSSIIEKYGRPDEINELIDYRNNEHIWLYYGEIEIEFYFKGYNLTHWFLNNNFSEYSDLLNINKLNKNNIKRIFGKSESEGFHRNAYFVSNVYFISYKINNGGVLTFNFEDNKLTSIVLYNENVGI